MEYEEMEYERRSDSSNRRGYDVTGGRRDSDVSSNQSNNVEYVNIIKSGIYIFLTLAAAFATYYNVIQQQHDLSNEFQRFSEIFDIKDKQRSKDFDEMIKDFDQITTGYKDHATRLRLLEYNVFNSTRVGK